MSFLGISSAGSVGAGAGASTMGTGGTLLAAAPVISAVSGGISAIGTANAQRSVLQYQQSVAQANQLLANQQATDALSQGTYAEMNLRTKAAQIKGEQQAGFGANGVALNEGSPVAVAASTDAMRDADIATIRNNAARAAWGYTVQGGNYGARANALGSAAGAVSPVASGATSLLGSASGVAGKWYDLYKNGAFGTSAPDPMPSGSSVFSSSGG